MMRRVSLCVKKPSSVSMGEEVKEAENAQRIEYRRSPAVERRSLPSRERLKLVVTPRMLLVVPPKMLERPFDPFLPRLVLLFLLRRSRVAAGDEGGMLDAREIFGGGRVDGGRRGRVKRFRLPSLVLPGVEVRSRYLDRSARLVVETFTPIQSAPSLPPRSPNRVRRVDVFVREVEDVEGFDGTALGSGEEVLGGDFMASRPRVGRGERGRKRVMVARPIGKCQERERVELLLEFRFVGPSERLK
jgi:hypothetical protein